MSEPKVYRDDPTPLSYDWLRARGFRTLSRGELQPTPHVRRDIARETAAGRRLFDSPDDLCIELAADEAGGAAEWFCWVVQAEPRRSIHVRKVRWTWEVVRLWEGLTGREWVEPEVSHE